MRRVVLCVLGCVAALTAGADARWLETRHDFGAFDEDLGVVTCEFRLVNESAEPMAIIGARANCGCTRPEYSREPIAPGDTAVIRVGFDPKGRPGRFIKYINVDLDDTPMRTSLSIHGTVIGASNTLRTRYPITVGPMKLRAPALTYGDVWIGHTASQYLEAYNASSDTLHPVAENVPRYMDVRIEPASVPPGESFIFATTLRPDLVGDWGVVTDSMTVRPEAGSAEAFDVATVCIVGEDFSKLSEAQLADAPRIDIESTAVDLSRLSRSAKPLKRTLKVANRGKSPLHIRAVKCADPAVEVEVKPQQIKPGKSGKLIVRVNPAHVAAGADMINARVNVISDDPLHPSEMVRVVAELTD